jgi:hypothetical protein
LRRRLNILLVKVHISRKQSVQTFWFQDGDLNTRFFHATASTEDGNGVVCRNEERWKGIPHNYFVDLSQKTRSVYNNVIGAITTMVTIDYNDLLTTPFS